tara:strand:- start:7098 stop:7538 length:441 start_codon:yes stop_codon:yes gene_type:complete
MKPVKSVFNNFLFINLFCFLFLLIQSCSNQQLGKELSESFEPSEELPSRSNSKSENFELPDKEKKQINNIVLQVQPNKSKQNKKESIRPKLDTKKNKYNKYKTQNYLVIIKIFDANSAAPGENITNILMKEGVEFEVQKIEKIEKK